MKKIRFNILTKLLLLLLLLTVVPLSLLGFFAINDAKALGYQAADEAQEMGKATLQNSRLIGDIALEGSTNALNDLGAKLIEQKAIDVAKQLEIYMKQNPYMTVYDLQNDEYFKALAVQQVGDTGYTAVHEFDSLINRFHANPAVVNMDLNKLADPRPEFFAILVAGQSGNDASGYYNWDEADGSVAKKYMHVAMVDAVTSDGVSFAVAATTYIDEFNKPVIETNQKISEAINTSEESIIASNERTEANIKAATEGLTLQNKILFITIGTILIVIVLGILFSRTITRPIVNLKNIANDVVDGNMDAQFSVSTTDEIKDLTIAMEALVSSLKYFRKESENSDVVKENSEGKKNKSEPSNDVLDAISGNEENESENSDVVKENSDKQKKE
jgi:nitrogen fixation/metabolism regulation signal transduction histidine kinase